MIRVMCAACGAVWQTMSHRRWPCGCGCGDLVIVSSGRHVEANAGRQQRSEQLATERRRYGQTA